MKSCSLVFGTMGKHGAQANVTFNMLNGIVSEDNA
jgi:hypothetical protein